MRRWLLTPLVASLFLVSFAESWAALVHAARTAGIPYPDPWPWMVDGFIVAMALMVVESDRDRRARFAWWPRVGLVAATGLSVWIQAAYAPQGGEWLAAWSPLAVLFSFECLVWLWRPNWEPALTPSAVPQPATVPAPAGPPPGAGTPPVETRPKVAQGAPRPARPAALGRPTFTPTQLAQIEGWVAEGRTNKSQMIRELGWDIGSRQYKELGQFVNQLKAQPVQVGSNGHGGNP